MQSKVLRFVIVGLLLVAGMVFAKPGGSGGNSTGGGRSQPTPDISSCQLLETFSPVQSFSTCYLF